MKTCRRPEIQASSNKERPYSAWAIKHKAGYKLFYQILPDDQAGS
jgi:hypothetical protein